MSGTTKTSKSERLKARSDFLRVQKGERLKGPFFLLEVLARDDAEGRPRVGFTVTKRQGNAVERNRIKRRLREAVRLAGESAMRPGHDYVLVGRRDCLSASFSRLTSSLKDRIEGRRFAARPKTDPTPGAATD